MGASESIDVSTPGTVGRVVSSLFVLSVTVVLLLASRSVLPVAAFALAATLRQDRRRAASGRPEVFNLFTQATRIGPDGPPDSVRAARRAGYRDPLAPHRAIVGPDAHTPWYIRFRAIVLLILIVAAIGAGIAGVTLLLIASGRFVLELLAG